MEVPADAAPSPLDEGWEPPAEFDEYRLLRPLGRGRTGRVYLAHDTLLDRVVAVKFIPALNSEALARFMVEARAAARIQHPNVVTLFRVGQHEEQPYLVSEYVRGVSLDRLKRPVPPERARTLALGLVRGLAAAHRAGVLHRDLKPGNAVLAESGEVKLLDFGLAKLLDVPRPSRPTPTPTPTPVPETAAPAELSPEEASGSGGELDLGALTSGGALVGTPYFMAPEAWRGEEATAQSDLYSLGVLLYELCAGRGPFRHVPLRALSRTVQEEDARPLAEVVPGIPPELAAVVDRCLRRDPAARFPSADALLDALEALEAKRAPARVPEGNPYRGLRAFEAEHRALFFGRRREVGAVVERLRGSSFVLVTGDSGVGKSSLCFAGVLPWVEEGALEDRRRWQPARMVPGRRPLAAAATALAPLAGQEEAPLEALLRDDPTAVVRTLRARLGASAGLVLQVDQLEELVTLSRPDEAVSFAELLGLLGSGVPGLKLLATARSDFLTRLGALPGLGEQLPRALFLLRPLGREEMREAVVGPARVKGARFESEALVATLVDSTARTEGGLPLLQFALAELWEARERPGDVITARALAEMGGVEGALARYADGAVDALLPEQRAAARKLLMRLVTVEGTRARRGGAELLGTSAHARAALEALIGARLLVAHESEEGTTYEIAHEALITGWGRLARWLAEASEARQLHQRLELAAAEWERLGRRREQLWSARQLAEVSPLEAASLSTREVAFLEASRRAVRRSRLVTRVVVGGFILSLLGVYAGVRLHTWWSLERKISRQLASAQAQLEDAQARAAALAAARQRAFALYDRADPEAAGRAWEAAQREEVEAERAFSGAGFLLERTLMLDPGRPALQAALADFLLARAALADRLHRPRERDAALERLRLYDMDGERWRRWFAPLSVSVDTAPVGATVVLWRFVPEEDGSLRAERVQELGRTPLREVMLERGSWMLELSAPGYAPVRYPLVSAGGGATTVSVRLLPERAVPEGFVHVPRGRFLYGTAADERVRQFFNAVPLHEVETDEFFIARHETTYADWMAYLESLPAAERALRTPHGAVAGGMHGTVSLTRDGDGRWRLRLQPDRTAYEALEGEPIRYRERASRAAQDWRRFPVGGISYEDARAYAAWLDRTGRVPGARLCTEREWERAARGADGREYPHGDRLAPDDANFDATYGKRPGAFGPDMVGSHPASRSPFGLDDMVGNVWEWVDSSLEPGRPAARGGSYFFAATTCRATNRETPDASYRDLTVGLRLCATPRMQGR